MEDKLEKKNAAEGANKDYKFDLLQMVDSQNSMETNTRDLVLWREIKKGNTIALGELYDNYIKILYPYGITICSNKSLAMDSIHDLFVDLFKYRNKLANNPQVKYYLLKSLKRKIYKKAGKKGTGFDKLEDNNLLSLDYFESSAEKKLIDSENDIDQKQRVNKALQVLSKKQKKAIQLKFYEGRSYEEIAGIMNVTIETSRTLIYRSMITLRQNMSNFSLLIIVFMF